MNCKNEACLFNCGLDVENPEAIFNEDAPLSIYSGKCTSEPHNVQPTSLPINCCPKFLEEGLPGDEFLPVFSLNPEAMLEMNKEEFERYQNDMVRVRYHMHEKTL